MSELDSTETSTRRPAQLAVPVDPSRDHVLGPLDAPVTVLEYGDYECPDCGRAYPLLKELQVKYPDRLRFVFRHFPLFTVHEHASTAAQAAEAAGAQHKFWQMHDVLYENQVELANADLTHHALRLGLDVYRFDAALGDQTFRRRVEEDYASGVQSGVKGTPTLFINGTRYEGKMETEALSEAVKKAMK